MGGPPGSRAQRGLPSKDHDAGGGSAPGKPKKASRLLVYIRVRHKEVFRGAVLSVAVVLLLFLVAWLAGGFRDSGYPSAEEMVKNGGLSDAQEAQRQRQMKRREHHRLKRIRARLFSSAASGKYRGSLHAGDGAGNDDGTSTLAVIRNPFRSSGGTGGVGLLGGKGTDVYEASREGEILGKWDASLGLEIDAWDPRTHDPDHPAGKQLGEVVQADNAAGGKGGKAPSCLAKSGEQKHYLTVVTFNRLFPGDVSNMTAYECIQWVEYYKYAGASHVVWYDTSPQSGNSVEREMASYIQSGFVTYLRFYSLFHGVQEAKEISEEQDKSILHAVKTYGASTTWLAAFDVDEYATNPEDTKPGFLERYLRLYEQHNPEASQLLLQNFLFIGDPERPLPALVIERYTDRSAESEGVSLQPDSMMKPIVRPGCLRMVYWKHPHHMEMAEGKTMAIPADGLRVNHYWGSRLPDWEFQSKLVKDTRMQPIADELKILLKNRRPKGRWQRGAGTS